MSASGNYGPTRSAPASSATPTCARRARRAGAGGAHPRAGGGRFRGIRHAAAWDADPALATSPTRHRRACSATRPSARASPSSRRSGCLRRLAVPPADPRARPTLARAFPETPIVLEPRRRRRSAIGPYAGRRDEIFATWAASIRELAACPNVYVKLGGIGMRLVRQRLPRAAEPALIRGARRGLAAVRRDLHRGVRAVALHVREQLPRGQGRLPYAAYWNACKILARGASATRKPTCSAGRPSASTD